MDLKELTYYTKILIYICIGAYGWWMILIYICIGAYGWMNRPIRVDFATIGWKSSILNFDLVSSIGAIELKFWGGPNSSGPSKLPLCKHNHAFSSFLNSLLLLKSINAFQLLQHMMDGVQHMMDRGTSYDG